MHNSGVLTLLTILFWGIALGPKPSAKRVLLLKSRKFGNLRMVFPAEKGSGNLIPEKEYKPQRNLITFPNKCYQNPMIFVSKT